MPHRNHYLHGLLREIARDPARPHALAALAARAGRSKFGLQRAFRALAGETPKQYALRLRLERAAGWLATRDDTVLAIALAAGFESHEVFTRAFRRRYGCSPAQFRRGSRRTPSGARKRHAAVIVAAGPCTGLFHVPLERWLGRAHATLNESTPRRPPKMPTSTIEQREVPATPILFIRRQVSRAEIAATIGQCLGAIFMYVQKGGLAVGGPPLSRYPSAGPGLVTIDVAFPLAAPAAGEGEVRADFLSAGPTAVATHEGSYETLGETYAALERWMTQHGATPRGAPWEVYLTDPAERPNPADWRTEVFWPVTPAGG